MAKSFPATGLLAAFMGAAPILPVVVGRMESGRPSAVGIAVGLVGGGMAACGLMTVLAGLRRRRRRHAKWRAGGGRREYPLSGFLCLGIERPFGPTRRQDCLLSQFLFLPALASFCGLLAARPWAWWTARSGNAKRVKCDFSWETQNGSENAKRVKCDFS